MAVHSLFATPETIIWGRFSAAQKPVLTVQPGDTVIIETFNGQGSVFPPENSGMHVAPAHSAIVETPTPEGRPGHLLTGPVAIVGAEPGDVLEVRIEAVTSVRIGDSMGFRPSPGRSPATSCCPKER